MISRKSILSSLLLAASLLVSSTALASDPGQDEVALKNGGTVRGTVIEETPGTLVKILVVGTETPRVIPWSEVGRVEKGKFAPYLMLPPSDPAARFQPPPPATFSPPSPPPPELSTSTPGVVRLHVQSMEPAEIHQSSWLNPYNPAHGRAFGLGRDSLVCSAPCDTVIDGSQGQLFRVTGDFDPVTFSTAGRTGDATLRVSAGSKATSRGGATLIVLGIVGTIASTAFLIVGATSTTLDPITGDSHHDGQPMLEAGGVTLGVSAASVGIGIGMIYAATSHAHFVDNQTVSSLAARKPVWWKGEF